MSRDKKISKKTRNNPLTVRVDDACYNFLNDSVQEKTLRDLKGINELKEKGIKVKRKNTSISGEVYKSIEIIKGLADHYHLETVEDFHNKLQQMIDVLDTLYLIKEKHGTDRVIEEIKNIV